MENIDVYKELKERLNLDHDETSELGKELIAKAALYEIRAFRALTKQDFYLSLAKAVNVDLKDKSSFDGLRELCRGCIDYLAHYENKFYSIKLKLLGLTKVLKASNKDEPNTYECTHYIRDSINNLVIHEIKKEINLDPIQSFLSNYDGIPF